MTGELPRSFHRVFHELSLSGLLLQFLYNTSWTDLRLAVPVQNTTIGISVRHHTRCHIIRDYRAHTL